MRILYSAIDQEVPGTKGGSTHVRAVAEGLAARGHEVVVAATPGRGGFPEDTRVTWWAIAAPRGMAQLRLLRRSAVRDLVRAAQPDVVIERYHNFGGEGLLAARGTRARTVLEVNAPVVDYPGSPKRLVDRLLIAEPMRRWRDWQCRTADLIVTPTRAILPDWVPAARVLETEWGADTDRFRPDTPATLLLDPHVDPRPDAGVERVTIMFVGAFRAWHGVHHLLRAMEQLKARGRAAAFEAILIGDGPERAPAAARIEASRLDNVTLLGPKLHDDIPGYLAAADIGIAPFDVGAHAPLALTFYWSPLKVFEYMAAGLPVVAPDIPRLRAIVRPDVDGLLYDAARPDALADALDALADPARRAAMGVAARARVVQQFSWAAHCARLEAALQALL